MSSYPKAVISTSLGDMTVELWNDVAPKHVENFLKLGRDGFYDHVVRLERSVQVDYGVKLCR